MQEGCPIYHAGAVFAIHTHLHTAVSAHSHEDGIITLFKELINGFHPGIQPDFHARIPYHPDFPLQNFRRQTVIRNTHPHHATGYRKLLKNGYPVPQLGQVVTRRQPCRAGANYGRFLACCGQCARVLLPLAGITVSYKSLQRFNRYRLIQFTAPAGFFAGMDTYPPQRRREGNLLPDNGESVLVFALSSQINILRHVDFRRTGIPARNRYRLMVKTGLVFGCLIHQRPGGADLNTRTAKAAPGILESSVKGCADNRIKATIYKAVNAYAAHLKAHLHAASAKNT